MNFVLEGRDVSFRFADRDDLETLVDLWIRLAEEQREYGSQLLGRANRDAIRDTMAAYLHSDGVIVAVDADGIIGFTTFSIENGVFSLDSTRGVISNIYVTPSERNRGIGSALLEMTEGTLADRGADTVMLDVMAMNDRARRFYTRHGYDRSRITLTREMDDGVENDTPSKEGG